MALVMGLAPGIFLKPMQPTVERLLQRVSRQTVAANPAPAGRPQRDRVEGTGQLTNVGSSLNHQYLQRFDPVGVRALKQAMLR